MLLMEQRFYNIYFVRNTYYNIRYIIISSIWNKYYRGTYVPWQSNYGRCNENF
jgi:hypothetical protein